jgi:FAD/FMN-containing dehydrogenase
MPVLPAEFINQLRKMIVGELRTDLATRKLYSTDGSIYQIEPLGVVFPQVTDDLQAIVQAAADYKIPVLPRGSGSSLAGQAIGPALIIDCSRHLNRLVEINPEECTATVEPGLILTELNRAAAKVGLQFGPDPASADRASMGGCIGNNAAGAHSIVYGMVADHLQSAEVILSDGSLAQFEAQSLEAAQLLSAQNNRMGVFYRAALKIREAYPEAIQRYWPKTWRRVSGYNLNYLLPWSPSRPPQWAEDALPYPPVPTGTVNLAHLLAGSEGTLAVVQRAQVRLVHRPQHTILGVLSYPGIVEACEAVPGLLGLNPSAIELIPESLIRLARSVPAYAYQLTFVSGEPAALLVVEFAGDDPNLLQKRLQELRSRSAVDCLVAETDAQQKQVWAVRKVGLGILMSRPGDIKPVAFIEDIAVPVEHLGQFVREMEKILAAHGTTADYYAHASAGCLHARPLLSLKTAQGKTSCERLLKKLSPGFALGGAVAQSTVTA